MQRSWLCVLRDSTVARIGERNTDGTFGAGNPRKPHGTCYKATTAALALLDGQAEALTQKAIKRR
jgi:hypothetical protein